MSALRRSACALAALGIAAAAGGCTPHPDGGPPALRVPNPERGRALASARGCASCHVIQGVESANGTIGPPLDHWSERQYIAGVLPNTPAQLERWILKPQAVKPGIAMPDLALSDSDASDIVAYLFSRP